MTTANLIVGSGTTPGETDGKRSFIAETGQYRAIMYGPYEERAPGRYRIEFEIGLADDQVPAGSPVCAILDVSTNVGQVLFEEQYLLHSQLSHGLSTITLEFDLQETRQLEYRVFSTGKVPLLVSDAVKVERVSDVGKFAHTRTSEQQRWLNEREFLDGYLRNISGLIHVGANLGQERRYYWIIGLDVVWVEPIREIYGQLVDNIAAYPRQRAVNALLADRTGDEVEFQIANNNGASSSMLALQDHAVIFPDVTYVERRMLTTKTLVDLVRDEGIQLDAYQALTLDVEGAERLILEGAAGLLDRFTYVKCEVADFPARTGTPSVADLDRILTAAGFAQLGRRAFADGPGDSGTFWDVVWKKEVHGQPLHEPGYLVPIVFNPAEVEGIEKLP